MKKPFYKSKTIWAALLHAALFAYSPFVEQYVKENPTLWACTISFLFIVLRYMTGTKIR